MASKCLRGLRAPVEEAAGEAGGDRLPTLKYCVARRGGAGAGTGASASGGGGGGGGGGDDDGDDDDDDDAFVIVDLESGTARTFVGMLGCESFGELAARPADELAHMVVSLRAQAASLYRLLHSVAGMVAVPAAPNTVGAGRATPTRAPAGGPASLVMADDGETSLYNPDDEWEIAWDALKMERKRIGQGTFGEVFKGFWHGPVAVKKLKQHNIGEAVLAEFKNEVAALRRTRHDNVLLFQGACTNPSRPLAIVTQWMEGGSLYQNIHAQEDWVGQLQKDQGFRALSIAKKIALGMAYLHAKHIVHRDLKSPNILLSKERKLNHIYPVPQVRIADFGLAMMKSSNPSNKPAGSVLWMPPEVITMKDGEEPFSQRSDAYAFGLILFEMATGTLPYKGWSIPQIVFNVGRGNAKLPLGLVERRIRQKEALTSTIEACVAHDPKARPGFEAVVVTLKEMLRKTPVLHRTATDMFNNRGNLGQPFAAVPRDLSFKLHHPSSGAGKAGKAGTAEEPKERRASSLTDVTQRHQETSAVHRAPTVAGATRREGGWMGRTVPPLHAPQGADATLLDAALPNASGVAGITFEGDGGAWDRPTFQARASTEASVAAVT